MRQMRLGFTGALLLLLPATSTAAEFSVQEALLRAKPAVALVVAEVGSEVLVNCGGRGEKVVRPAPFRETGTGWFVSPSGWMITNAHVVSPAHRPPAWVADQQARRAVREACGELPPGTLAATAARARVKLDPSISVILSNGIRLTPTVSKYSPPVTGQSMSGRDLALLKLETADMPTLSLADSANAQIGDKLHVLGFPGVVLSHELLNASAKVEASVTSGAISGFKQDVQNQPVIQTDAPAAWGNSGGPAVNAQGDIVGVLTFVSLAPGAEGSIVQGFNFIIPADAVKEFLRGTKVDLGERSPFNEKWFSGLRKFFGDDWSGALEDIKAADRLQPEFPDLRRLMTEAGDKIKNPPPRPFPWRPVVGAVVLLIVGAAVVVVFQRMRWDRLRMNPADLLRLSSGGIQPALLDVRDSMLYRASPYRVPGAVRVNPDQLESELVARGIDRARTVVTCCIADERNSARG